MTSKREFEINQKRAAQREALAELYRLAVQRITDNRMLDAAETAETAEALAEGMSDHLALAQWPFCFPCQGTGEMPSPVEVDRKVRCQDVPEVCKGNQYGRMHPSQFTMLVRSLCPRTEEVSAVSERPREEGEETPEKPEEPKPDSSEGEAKDPE